MAPGLDAGGGSALGPRGNSSLHTPSTFFQQEKYYPQKKKYTMKKKILSGLKENKLQSRVCDFFLSVGYRSVKYYKSVLRGRGCLLKI